MPNYLPGLHHRWSIRLCDYDYAQAGLYFITICVQDRACLMGHILRNKTSYHHLTNYIRNNPAYWNADKLNLPQQ